ncbi:hypothetical protein ACH5RR_039605 [Cinchona calisaya]|uniref:Aminotransferase-like plant mobile domain-containing protein n=1 Tax=Cinchona calisaya TaxID=153742 RepID=A0ABD2Y245_9GENT
MEVKLDITLLRGNIVKCGGEARWVDFKYERCSNFGNSCRIIGHWERVCPNRKSSRGCAKESQYGRRLRIDNGKGIMRESGKIMTKNAYQEEGSKKERGTSLASSGREGACVIGEGGEVNNNGKLNLREERVILEGSEYSKGEGTTTDRDGSQVRGKKYLVILNDENDLLLDGTMFPVHTLLYGAFSNTWGALANPYDVKEWTMELNSRKSGIFSPYWLLSLLHSDSTSLDSFTTLADEVLSSTTHWGSKLKFGGEFSPIYGYWNWTMEILGRNEDTLVKAGEISISLCYLHILGGLPVTRVIYEEIIPSYSHLRGMNKKKKRFISPSCEYLFRALQILQAKHGNQENVSITKWVEFWYEFKKTSLRKSLGRSRSTHNPSGHYEPRAKKPIEERAFVDLGLDTCLWEETYLAAFLSCWPCAFVLPNDEVNLVHPTTFKAATWIAQGTRYSFVVPVLSSIYHGLARIAQSPKPSQSKYSYFPIHYVVAWIEAYFDIYVEATKITGPMMAIFSGMGGAKQFSNHTAHELVINKKPKWHATMYCKTSPLQVVDNGSSEIEPFQYIISICSCYLFMRSYDSYYIESYSPCRFSRQFGCFQYIPGDRKKVIHSASVHKVLQLWRICLLTNSNAHAFLLGYPTDLKALSTRTYKEWWSRVHGDYWKNGVEVLIRSTKAMPRKERVNINSTKGHECNEVESSSKDDIACDATEPNNNAQSVEHMNSISHTLSKRGPGKGPIKTTISNNEVVSDDNKTVEAQDFSCSDDESFMKQSPPKVIKGKSKDISLLLSQQRRNPETLTIEHAEVEKPKSKQTPVASISMYRPGRMSSNIIVHEEIHCLQMKEADLKKDLQSKVEAMEAAAINVKLAKNLVNEEDMNLVMTTEDEKKLEELKEKALNFQKSLSPSAWMDIDA